ncbi:MAG: DoxX family protein [Corynebacterium sp.]|uniref:DoxX family protein n=1 Tax=Corynebacterium sp. TaxID=1720 RepID=UPI0026DDCB38|nr:DoxX family protein [Corynebacterium sp.]MDO5097865.1 DoxX family protein [Corynebacterium sp.]
MDVVSWMFVALGVTMAGDVVLCLKPPTFIRECIAGVNFPSDWSWALLVAKGLAAIGLFLGVWISEFGVAAASGLVVYFVCALIAHLRARFTAHPSFLSCVFMLVFSLAVAVCSAGLVLF